MEREIAIAECGDAAEGIDGKELRSLELVL
jgi:hypothetical protein